MADELVRIKVQNSSGAGLAGALVRILDEDEKVLKAQGITSIGPTPAVGIFETVLSGSASPGTGYVMQVLRNTAEVKSRSFFRVIT